MGKMLFFTELSIIQHCYFYNPVIDMSRVEIYVPSVAKFPEDLEARNKILDPVRRENLSAGLMLILTKSEDVEGKVAQKQLDNLEPFVKLGYGDRPVVFFMHPWKPLTGTTDNPLNFLTNGDWSREYVEKTIDLVAKVPDELTPETGRAMTFHLSAYVTPDQWKPDPNFWEERFSGVMRHIKEVVEYGRRNNVKVHIETVPVPPWGDWAVAEESKIPGTLYYYRDFGTPWPLVFHWRDEIKKLRELGAFLTVDWCHTSIALLAVRDAKKLIEKDNRIKDLVLSTYMIFESDLGKAREDNLSNDIDQLMMEGDVIHANQSTGVCKIASIHGEDAAYGDSASLIADGNIKRDELTKLIKKALGLPGVKFVVEVNEPKGQMLEAPNTKASLAEVLRIASQVSV